MNYIGKWIFHSIGVVGDDDNFKYLSADEYILSPMPYIDETDNEALEDEINERKRMVKMQIKVCADGKLYMLMPLPEGVSDKEIREAEEAGEITLCDGMLNETPLEWQERNGELWYKPGIGDEDFIKATDESGYFIFMTMRFKKAD